MTRQELLETMSPGEFKQWVAYFSLQGEEYKERMEKEIALENTANKTQEQLAQDMKAMLMGLSK